MQPASPEDPADRPRASNAITSHPVVQGALAAAQVRGSPYRFARPTGASHLFALTQGYIFKKTESLLYVITIHLTLDLVLFLALLNVHTPTLADIFLLK